MMSSKQQFGILFSDVFGVQPEAIEAHGALNISLVADLPLFIDPFLLFHSEKPEYQVLHNGMIEYLRFLRDQAVAGNISKGLLEAWFHFKEVDNTWLGFAVRSNRGSGLGNDFARALCTNFAKLLNPDQSSITKSYHLEKLCLIASGVGRDRISDFTTNLIKGFLCEYTQAFAIQNVAPDLRRKFIVPKAEFNYETKAWKAKGYELPCFKNNFVLLVPSDILARDETWINNRDLASRFTHLPASLPDDAIRAQVNEYFLGLLPKEPTVAETKFAIRRTLLEYPELIDYYIKIKEDTGKDAKSIANSGVAEVDQFLLRNASELIRKLRAVGFYDVPGVSYDNALARAKFIKQVIEHQDGYRLFWHKNLVLPKREEDIQILSKFAWFGTAFDVNYEVDNGRGPVDLKVSAGAADKCLIEFKLASNSKLKKNLTNQLKIYQAANQTKNGIKIIIYFTKEEETRLFTILDELNLTDAPSVVTIDARNDNKPSGSLA